MRSNFAPQKSVPWWSELESADLEKLAEKNPKVADNIRRSKALRISRVTVKTSPEIGKLPVVSTSADTYAGDVRKDYEVARSAKADCSIDIIVDADLASCFEDSRSRILMAYIIAIQASEAQIALKSGNSGEELADVNGHAVVRGKMPGRIGRRILGWNLFGRCIQRASKSRNLSVENSQGQISSCGKSNQHRRCRNLDLQKAHTQARL